jgi:hypothetical protein
MYELRGVSLVVVLQVADASVGNFTSKLHCGFCSTSVADH